MILMFYDLQTSKKRAAETTDLTRSFGWDSSEGKVLVGIAVKVKFWLGYQ